MRLSLWSKAQAAFAAGNLDEAVSTAQDVKAKIEPVAATLKLDLPRRRQVLSDLQGQGALADDGRGAARCAPRPRLPLSISRRTLTCPGRFIW